MHTRDRARRWRGVAVVGLALAWASGAGCGGASYGPAVESTAGPGAEPQLVEVTPAEHQMVSSYPDDVQSLETELLGQLELAEIDCDTAGDLAERICGLSERICGVAERHPEWRDVQDKCEDGRDRCATARERVAMRCE